MKMEVYCTVDNCHYWASGNHCHASQILVTADSYANQAPDNIDAPQGSTLQATPVDNCMETACKTFVDKGGARATIQSDRVTYQQ